MKFNYHSLKYDKKQSWANKDFPCSDHTSHKKHYNNYHLNIFIDDSRYAAKMKKEEIEMLNSVS